MQTEKVPSFLAGFFGLWVFAIVIAVFGVAGWIFSDANIWQKTIIGIMTGLAAFVIPTTVVAVGRSAASIVIVFTACVCAMITAYSFHHAVEILIEEPRRVVYLKEEQAEVVRSAEALEKARKTAAEYPAAVLPECKCPLTIKSTVEAWEMQRQPVLDAVELAKDEHTEAKAARDARLASYKSIAPDWVVWLAGALVDLAVALGIFGLEATRHAIKRKLDKQADLAEQAEQAFHVMSEELQEEEDEIAADIKYLNGISGDDDNVFDLNDLLGRNQDKIAS